MKKHLFYTFLAIFVATAIVTLLGVTGVLRIADGYLTALVGAFLIESAGAVVAMFRTAEFFTDDEKENQDETASVKQELEAAREKLSDAVPLTNRLREEVARLQAENQQLQKRLADVDSFRLRIVGVLGSTSADRSTLLRELNLAADSPERDVALSVIGQLVDEKRIEPDPQMPRGYYRLCR
jgi:hypothetical protein